jgi:hypothetical protein
MRFGTTGRGEMLWRLGFFGKVFIYNIGKLKITERKGDF